MTDSLEAAVQARIKEWEERISKNPTLLHEVSGIVAVWLEVRDLIRADHKADRAVRAELAKQILGLQAELRAELWAYYLNPDNSPTMRLLIGLGHKLEADSPPEEEQSRA